MEHVVFFTGPSGPGFRRVPDLAEALASVEHLRNVAGIDDATVHALTLVPLQFKTYVKVEVTGQPAEEPEAVLPELVEMGVPAIEPAMEPMAANGAAPVSLEEFAPSAEEVPGVPDPAVAVAEAEAELPMQRTEAELVPETAGGEAPDSSHDADVDTDASHDVSHDVLPEPHPVRAGRGMGFFQR